MEIDFDDPDAVYAFRPSDGRVRLATPEERLAYEVEQRRRVIYVLDRQGNVARVRPLSISHTAAAARQLLRGNNADLPDRRE